MKKVIGINERIEIIRKLLAVEGSVTSHEIYLHMIPMGLNNRHVELSIQTAYKSGVLHRRKNTNTYGYEYRLAEKYPRWGTRYIPDTAKWTRRSKTIALCKKASRIYQVDQLLKPVRCQYAAH